MYICCPVYMFRQGKHCTPILNHGNNFFGCYKNDSVTVPKMSKCGFFSRPCFPLFGLNTGNYEPKKIRYSLRSVHYIIVNIKLFLALQKIAANTAAFFFFFILCRNWQILLLWLSGWKICTFIYAKSKFEFALT